MALLPSPQTSLRCETQNRFNLEIDHSTANSDNQTNGTAAERERAKNEPRNDAALK